MRRLHLIDKHHYPKNYPFDIAMTGTLSIEEHRARKKRAQSRSKPKPTNNTVTDMDVDNLVAGMSRLSIPESISFGRAKPSLRTHSKHTKNKMTIMEE